MIVSLFYTLQYSGIYFKTWHNANFKTWHNAKCSLAILLPKPGLLLPFSFRVTNLAPSHKICISHSTWKQRWKESYKLLWSSCVRCFKTVFFQIIAANLFQQIPMENSNAKTILHFFCTKCSNLNIPCQLNE